MINWEQDAKRTERGIQMLLLRRHPGLRSLDGAGGDGGRDAQLITGDGLTVFEIKSFGRLNSSRRRQVERSLSKAVKSAPNMTRWVLVLPMNMTPARPGARSSEEAWFDEDLPLKAPGVRLDWRGLDWLDAQVAESMDVQRYIEGTDGQLLQRAKEFDMEQAVIAGGADDLRSRITTLQRRLDEVSSFWTLDFSVIDGVPTTALRAKVPDAHILDPITITHTVAFREGDPEDDALRQRFEHTLAFGGSVELPAGYVTDREIQASPEARLLFSDEDPRTSGLAISSIHEQLDRNLRCHFQVLDGDERILSQFPVYLRERALGSSGATFYGSDAAEIMKFEISIPHPAQTPGPDGSLTMNGAGLHFDAPKTLVGYDVDSLVPVTATLAAAAAGTYIRFQLPGLGFVHGGPLTEAPFPQTPQTHQLISDLHRMQQHTGSVLRFPANATGSQVDDLRNAVRALDGETVEYEGGLTLHLRAESVGAFLKTLKSSPGAGTEGGFLGSTDALQLEVGDLTIFYGVAALWAPHPLLSNLEELEEMASSGHAPDGGVEARFEPTDARFRWVSREQAEAYFQSDAVGDLSQKTD